MSTITSTGSITVVDLMDASSCLAMKINHSAFNTADSGELYLHGFEDGEPADVNGYVFWKDAKRNVTKGVINPNDVVPFDKYIYIVLRLDSTSANTGTLYMVWYDGAWKYAITPTPPSIAGVWVWNETRDIVLGQFVEPGNEEDVTEAYLYNPVRSASEVVTTNQQTISEASKVATNYLEFDENYGLMIADMSNGHQTIPGATGKNVLIDSNSVDIRDGQDVRASFSETTVIGKPYVSGATNNESRVEIDYQSLRAVDKNGNEYFCVKDLRNEDGVAEIIDRFIGELNTIGFPLTFPATNNNYVVKVDDVIVTTGITKTTTIISFDTAPAIGAIITAEYETMADDAKIFTIGKRAFDGYYLPGAMSVAEGCDVIARGNYSHAEGNETHAIGFVSHAEGYSTESTGDYSHAEGFDVTASGFNSHAEGNQTIASGSHSHAEGSMTIASGWYAHAEGLNSIASGDASHASGNWTIASRSAQFTIGKYNDNQTDTAFEIGNGSADNARSNALTVDWLGGMSMYVDAVIDDDTTSQTYERAISGTDADLYNAIYDLGWTADVID